jgi:hypothetical protein
MLTIEEFLSIALSNDNIDINDVFHLIDSETRRNPLYGIEYIDLAIEQVKSIEV